MPERIPAYPASRVSLTTCTLAIATSIAIAISISISAPVALASTSTTADPVAPAPVRQHPEASLDVYAHAAQRIDIGSGRHLNLRCSGKGAPTVMLEAGFGSESLAWATLQPMVAKHMHVCSYDRAGYGFSDIGPMPRDAATEISDLHALMHAAKLATPVILVGHSLGSVLARRYDQRYPDDIAALVLVDPPAQNIKEFSPGYAKVETETMPQMFGFFRACEQGARAKQLDNPPPELKSCLRGPNPEYTATLNAAVHDYHARAEFWQTMISESQDRDAMYGPPIPADERHDKPVIVLTAAEANADALPADRKALDDAQDQTHRAIAATSKQGERITVAGASHDIQIDKPAIVLDAIMRARKAAAGNR